MAKRKVVGDDDMVQLWLCVRHLLKTRDFIENLGSPIGRKTTLCVLATTFSVATVKYSTHYTALQV